MVFIPKKFSDKPAMVVELKCDDTAEAAVAQIRERRYVEALEEYDGDVLLIGVSYDRETKEHKCRIERMGWQRSGK